MYSDALLEAVARARHDLGKYVALQARCLEPGASAQDLRSALDADLNHTRSSPDATCAELWAGLRGPLVEAGLGNAELAALDATILALADRGARLGELSAVALQETARVAIDLGEHLRGLHRRLLAGKPA